MDSFIDFIAKTYQNPLLFISILLALGVILVNGWTDAPNAIATCVVTRCIKPSSAILMAAVFNFLGVFVMTLINATVAETITKIVDFGDDFEKAIISVSAALFSIVLWAVIAFIFGIPTSESHALIAGLTGSAIAANGSLSAVNGSEWAKVLYGIVISVIGGFVMGIAVCLLVRALFKNVERQKSDVIFTKAQIAGAASMAFMHGAQDGQKFMGVILLLVYMSRGETLPADINIPVWLMILCSLVISAGTAIGGKKIIKSVGMDMVKLEKHQGFSADIAAALSLFLCSLLSLPVSTTHVKTTSIMGASAAKRVSSINFSVVKEMVLTWIFTFPGCALIGFFMTNIFLDIFS